MIAAEEMETRKRVEKDEEFPSLKVQIQHEVGDDGIQENRNYPYGNEISHNLRKEEDRHSVVATGILMPGE